MNLLAVRVDSNNEVHCPFAPNPDQSSRPQADLRLAVGNTPGPGQWLLGFRPEQARLASDGWPIAVEFVELLGAERLVHARMGSAPVVLRCDAAQPVPAAGESAAIAVSEGDLHWFDAATGQRVDH
jgi:sn-glycerol 3-phosphate transport system ATP-binding protein